MGERLVKIIVIGPSMSGKTSSIQRFCRQGAITQGYRATIGADICTRSILWDDDLTITLQLWDLGGQDHFANMSRLYYEGSVGCIVVFDTSDRESLSKAVFWKKDLDSKATLPSGSILPSVLFANKVDLQKNDWVTDSFMEKFCAENDFIGWFETSAVDLEDQGIETGVKFLLNEIISVVPDLSDGLSLKSDTVSLDSRNYDEDEEPSRCC